MKYSAIRKIASKKYCLFVYKIFNFHPNKKKILIFPLVSDMNKNIDKMEQIRLEIERIKLQQSLAKRKKWEEKDKREVILGGKKFGNLFR